MNILIVHEVSYVNKVVYEYQTMAELLNLRGHNVYVVDYDYAEYPYNLVNREYSGAYVHLITPPMFKLPVLSRASAFISHYFFIKEAIIKNKIDIIFLYSVPTNGLQTLHLAKKYGIPVVFRSVDVLHGLVKNKTLSFVTSLMESYVYKRVDKILAINNGLVDYVNERGSKDTELLKLGVDMNQYKPVDRAVVDELKRQYEIDGQVVMFVGTLPKFSGLDRVIAEFPEVLEKYPKAKLIIIGDGEQLRELEREQMKQILRDGFTYIIFTGMVASSEVPKFISMADVCLMPFEINTATRDIFPTKVIQYMAYGKPVVSSRMPGLMREIPEIVTYTDRISTGICKAMGSDVYQESLDYINNNHSYKKIIGQLEEVFGGMVCR